jgi:D-alanyl-D-alanine carboxypeptidase
MKKLALGLVAVVVVVLVVFLLWRPYASMPAGGKQASSSSSDNQAQSVKTFNKHKYSLKNPSSIWVIVNKHRPLTPKTYAPNDLATVGHGQQMRQKAASALAKMESSASKQGVSFYAASAYRSYDQQVAAYNSEVKAYGRSYADQESARPGYSEHQTGWAVDLGTSGCAINKCFANTAAGKWVAMNGYKYGFIIRYPKAQKSITGYEYEPWHLRYVGQPLAEQMHKKHILTLEKFFGLPSAPSYRS